MTKDWQDLTRITRGAPITIEKIKLSAEDMTIEGSFDPPPLARLTWEDQIFVTAFIRSHGSIKNMEEFFGISYPTVKNRLNRISQQLEFVEINPPASKSEVLDQLELGQIDVEAALRKLRGEK